jgi:hypothetical protein
MGEPSGGEPINWNPTTQISVPTPGTETRLAIRRPDWSRIRRNLARCKESQFNLSGAYWFLFGSAVSIGATIYPLQLTTGLPVWVMPLYISATVFTLVLGVVLVFVNKYQIQQRQFYIEDVEADMDEIERAFETPSTPGREGVVKLVTL